MSSSSSRLSLSFHEELLRLRGSRSGGREAGAGHHEHGHGRPPARGTGSSSSVTTRSTGTTPEVPSLLHSLPAQQ